jgi:hypothetical protein
LSSEPPLLIAINHDNYHAKHIGRTADGRQFFLTNPFVPAYPNERPGTEFIALYIFDKAGNLLDAKIDNLGPRASLNEYDAQKAYDRRLSELGNVTFQRIEVKPFTIQQYNVEFGLVLRPPEDDDDGWIVEVEPGNYMAFFAPWDSGDYDT